MVVMLAAAAPARFFFVMVAAATAPAGFFLVVVMAAAAAPAGIFVVMMMMVAAAAPAGFFFVVVMAAAAASAAAPAAAVAATGQRNGREGFVGGGHRQTHAFEHDLVLIDAGHGKAVFGLRHAHAAGGQGVNSFLHEVEVARHLEDRFHGRFDLVKAAVFVDEHVTDFERTHFAETVFDFGAVHLERGGQFVAFDEGEFDGSRAVQNGLGGLAVERKKFGNAHVAVS